MTIIVRNLNKGELYNQFKETGSRLIFCPLGYFSPFKMIQYYRFFKKEHFDVICDFNGNFGGFPIFLAKIVGTKSAISFYRQGGDHFQPGIFRKIYNNWLNRLVYKYSTHILSNSKAALSYFFSVDKSNDLRFQVIYNGYDLKMFDVPALKEEIRDSLKIPQSKFVVGHIGRLDSSKNHETILAVAKELISIDEEFHFVLCGRGTEGLMPRIAQLELTQNFTILGFREDVAYILKSFDCFLFPSLTEGQPNALIEAMFTGLPVIASSIDSIVEILPSFCENWLASPRMTNIFVDLLIQLKLKPEIYDGELLKMWAQNHFNGIVKFKQFEEVLNGW